MNQDILKEKLKSFLDTDGRLDNYPAKHKMKATALCYLAGKFEPETDYTEAEVNATLKEWHTFADWYLLRRDLCDLHFLGRERDGSRYWLEQPQPTPQELGFAAW